MRFKTNAKVKDNSGIGSFYTNSIQVDDYYLPVYFTPKRSLANIPFVNDSLIMDESYADQKNYLNFYYYNNDLNLESLEENYENIKNFKYIYIKNYKNLLLNSNNFLSPIPYSTILDSFRANSEENN
jgi:hypothetical protein